MIYQRKKKPVVNFTFFPRLQLSSLRHILLSSQDVQWMDEFEDLFTKIYGKHERVKRSFFVNKKRRRIKVSHM